MCVCVCVCVCVGVCVGVFVMCFLGSLLHIHAFPWGPVDRLLWESTNKKRGRQLERDSRRERRCVCACVCVCVCVCVLETGACVGRVVSVVWLVLKDLGAMERSRWREGKRAR